MFFLKASAREARSAQIGRRPICAERLLSVFGPPKRKWAQNGNRGFWFSRDFANAKSILNRKRKKIMTDANSFLNWNWNWNTKHLVIQSKITDDYQRNQTTPWPWQQNICRTEWRPFNTVAICSHISLYKRKCADDTISIYSKIKNII